VALEGAQAVARRHMEIMQSSMSEMTEGMKALATAAPPQAKAAKQAELVKKAYEQSVSNMKELGDLIQRSNAEAIGLLHSRFIEAMDEVKKLAEKH
jgi:phasin family protein